MPRPSLLLLSGLLSSVAAGACNPLVKVDVDCERLCLDVPGPTIPALSNQLPPVIAAGAASSDGGFGALIAGALDAGYVDAAASPPTADWIAELAFNKVLAQLPSAAAGLSADVRLTSVALHSTTDLDFIDAIEVTMSHARTSTSSAKATSNAAALDGGNEMNCRAAGLAMRVAYFRRIEAGPSGQSIALTMVAPDMNLFDCMKDAPTRFTVKLTPRLGTVATVDAPLALGTCIGVATHLRYP